MSLVRVVSVVDRENKIAIPKGMRKELGIKPGEKLELKIVGVNRARRVLLFKLRGGYGR